MTPKIMFFDEPTLDQRWIVSLSGTRWMLWEVPVFDDMTMIVLSREMGLARRLVGW